MPSVVAWANDNGYVTFGAAVVTGAADEPGADDPVGAIDDDDDDEDVAAAIVEVGSGAVVDELEPLSEPRVATTTTTTTATTTTPAIGPHRRSCRLRPAPVELDGCMWLPPQTAALARRFVVPQVALYHVAVGQHISRT
ncbi:MAG: hypothetical protein ACXV7I_04090, partial [Ilumatobacteraceae bacterium]